MARDVRRRPLPRPVFAAERREIERVIVAATAQIAVCLGGLVGAVLLDAIVRPRPGKGLGCRDIAGLWLLACQVAALYGLFLALCGNVAVSIVLALAVLAILVLASNAKQAMLGEPLVFSDLALIGAIFRHPQFYLSAVPAWQRAAVAIAAAALVAVVGWLFVPDLAPHMTGAGIMVGSLVALTVSLRSARFEALALVPSHEADVCRLGLTPALMLYWLRWRHACDPPPCSQVARVPAKNAPELLIVIQCESFADPVDLFGDRTLALPGLDAARDSAWQYGNLHVSGFGAYTMRTEYAVLFGREEEQLGFRRYDPFLTALGEASYALPARLGTGWRSAFIHPHDMRFYGREAIMPAAGFCELVGEERFTPPQPEDGRYVTDAAMADEILKLANAARQPSLLYAVTIENHGPWAPDAAGGVDLVASYMRLARHSDVMLERLIEGLAAIGRPAMLVFFGDHRPSIPGATDPGGPRHTPYVIVRLDGQGQPMRGENRRVDLTPASLHHAVLDLVLGARV